MLGHSGVGQLVLGVTACLWRGRLQATISPLVTTGSARGKRRTSEGNSCKISQEEFEKKRAFLTLFQANEIREEEKKKTRIILCLSPMRSRKLAS
jgi:hypothetical protein